MGASLREKDSSCLVAVSIVSGSLWRQVTAVRKQERYHCVAVVSINRQVRSTQCLRVFAITIHHIGEVVLHLALWVLSVLDKYGLHAPKPWI
nr:hypothetical protein CFP56_69522 [Quercus suber]